MLNIATFFIIFLVFGFSIIQFSLTLGAPFGEYANGGMHRVLPAKMRFVSGFSSVLQFIVGLSYLQRTGKIAPIFNVTFVNIILIIYTVFIAYAIVANGFITKSKKEKYLMTPLSIIGFISSLVVLSMAESL